MMDSEIREGFLCPVCLEDLGQISELQSHVAEAHRSEQEQRMVFQIKGLFDKAKQRILQIETNTLQPSDSLAPSTSGAQNIADPVFFEQQEPGAVRSHTKDFKKERDSRIDQMAVETNKLIIRLDKLISHSPTDPAKRKAFEKDMVPWVNDTDTSHCPFCASKFSLTRRKHHCRLCGKIMCHNCSQFLTFLLARKLTNPAFAAECAADPAAAERDCKSTSSGSPVKRAEKFLNATISSVLKRDGSELSLGSFLNQAGEDHLRICSGCKELLERRDQQMEQRSQPPLLVQMYERLRALMTELSKIYPSYSRMASSLNAGETMYTLGAAKELKLKIMKLQEQIDFVSKKILHHGLDPPSVQQPSPRQLLLQKNVRSFAANFLQETIMYIPNLPTPEEHEQLQKKYKEQLQRNIEQERLMVAQKDIQRTQSNPVTAWSERTGPNENLVDNGHSDGWTADTSALKPLFHHYNPFLDDQEPIDPLQQQILIIKSYLKQAAESGRMDEVKILEQNLRELEIELKQQNLATPR